MKKRILCAILCTLCFTGAFFTVSCSEGQIKTDGKTVTITSSNFNKKVLESDGLVLLDFWAEWCGPCKQIAPNVTAVAKERRDVLVGKVNVDDYPELANAYGVTSIPTLIVFKDGKLKRRAVGYKTTSQILAML